MSFNIKHGLIDEPTDLGLRLDAQVCVCVFYSPFALSDVYVCHCRHRVCIPSLSPCEHHESLSFLHLVSFLTLNPITSRIFILQSCSSTLVRIDSPIDDNIQVV